MKTQATRPGHMVPGWSHSSLDELSDEELSQQMLADAEAEATAYKWFDRIMFACLGASLGGFTLWLGLILAANCY